MRRLSLVSLFFMPLLLLLGSGAIPATASTSVPVTIHSSVQLGGEHPFGTWSASGGISDSGTLVEQTPRGSGGSNHVVIHIVRVVTGSQGSFTVRIESPIVGEEPNGNVDFAGHWVVIAGTGAYADLHGQGRRTAVADPTTNVVTETLTGTVHYD